MSTPSAAVRRMFRAALREDSVLTLEDAAIALPGRPEDAAPWLLAHVDPIGELGGEALYRWGDVLRTLSRPRPAASTAITTWRDAAAAIGVSEDTLARRRRERDPGQSCYFVDHHELLAWWRSIVAHLPPTRPQAVPRRAKVRAEDAPVDFGAVARRLIGDRGEP